jgi:hypothetical protein
VKLLIGVLAVAVAMGEVFDVSPSRLPAAHLGRTYPGGPIVAAGGGRCSSNTVAFQVAAGTLPPGLTLTPAGYFQGIPTEPGLFRFAVRTVNECTGSTREFSIMVSGAPILRVNPPALVYRVLAGQPLPESEILRVSSDTPHLAYSVQGPAAPWVEAHIGHGATPGADAGLTADTISLHFDSGRLTPGHHRTELIVSAWRAVAPVRVPIEVAVADVPIARSKPLDDHKATTKPADHKEKGETPEIKEPAAGRHD